MRKSTNQILFSASDLSNHIHCKHLTNLNYDVVQGLKERPISNNRVLDVLRERGIEFENSFLVELSDKFDKKDILLLNLGINFVNEFLIFPLKNGFLRSHFTVLFLRVSAA